MRRLFGARLARMVCIPLIGIRLGRPGFGWRRERDDDRNPKSTLRQFWPQDEKVAASGEHSPCLCALFGSQRVSAPTPADGGPVSHRVEIAYKGAPPGGSVGGARNSPPGTLDFAFSRAFWVENVQLMRSPLSFRRRSQAATADTSHCWLSMRRLVAKRAAQPHSRIPHLDRDRH
jgi:hypothetical protein